MTSTPDIIKKLADACYCEDCVDAEQQYDGSWKGSASTCLNCQAVKVIERQSEALEKIAAWKVETTTYRALIEANVAEIKAIARTALSGSHDHAE